MPDDRPASASSSDLPEPSPSSAASDGSSSASASSLDRLRDRVLATVSHHLPESADGTPSVEEPPKRTGSYARWLPVLRGLPWILGALFALSFAWDFPGVTFSVAGYSITLENLLRYTTVSGLIGFGTNWLAITMLFRPRQERPIVGQGLVPAQRERVAFRLAQAVSDELINKRIIMEKIRESGLAAQYRDVLVAMAGDVITDDEVRRETKTLLRSVLRDVLSSPAVQDRIAEFTAEQMEKNAEGLPGVAFRTYRLFGEEDFQERLRAATRRLPETVGPLLDELDPVLDRLPAHLERHGDTIEELLTQVILRLVGTLDVERIVFENVRAYDEQQLEMLLRRTTNEQLNYIKYLGAVLGIIGGLIIWAPAVSLAVVTTVGLVVYAVDEALFRSDSPSDTT
ncbi:hypothetical protein BSZ35_13515 [Salinibacter sp. 10B]|uniref:DUF445 domain-containing protein n=1 Tax=Salinibacter sp. 10B TaxID=1923971 RepID=UPI000CF43313|nr:DUF445 family protein [Salinibacter sp. 10B]PQJ35486.1 hypothetical protein BSZ35_13515 [Salinibacter sp. 10B]